MQPSELISQVKVGETPSTAALNSFCTGLADFSVSDAQGAAFAMAVCLKGLDVRGRKDLTLAMRDSGKTLSWNLDGPVLDKHSTGGLGDCVSLVLAPLLAAAGVYVPGGRAVYPSTLLMNVIPAQVAGVPRLVMVSPPNRETGFPHHLVCGAAALVGVEAVSYTHLTLPTNREV